MDPSKKKKSGTRTSFFKKAEIQMVEIRVGEELKLFRVHKSLLCTRVPYFDKILSKGFSESITNSAVLQEDNTEAFDVLVDWVYTNRLPPEIASGIRRYILADKICPPELMDQVMDRIRTEYPLGPPDVLDIYSRLPNGSKLRVFALDLMTLEFFNHRESNLSSLVDMNAKNEEFATDFLTNVRSCICHPMSVSTPRRNHHCAYHYQKDRTCKPTGKLQT
ncbi:uncharacterized protein EAF01_007604 [Botrytis porri]|uniref:uncharacterized protein n=1 Tax=Botrytis porri TaxID=87229 RepID=UPI0018FF42C3|nr:uncharacterized protein EAF01_007604 [Botrytis porri]KAF7900302.1 hypothetical protein EAF01_007604 [Botrytis porri]